MHSTGLFFFVCMCANQCKWESQTYLLRRCSCCLYGSFIPRCFFLGIFLPMVNHCCNSVYSRSCTLQNLYECLLQGLYQGRHSQYPLLGLQRNLTPSPHRPRACLFTSWDRFSTSRDCTKGQIYVKNFCKSYIFNVVRCPTSFIILQTFRTLV